MTIEQLIQDKTIKAKAKVASIREWILPGELPLDELLVFATNQKASDKATCIEALEFATKTAPSIANPDLLNFVIRSLEDTEPRVKWESAKVVGNIARLFPDHLEGSIQPLLNNAESSGTVVRWASAYGLAEILKLKTRHNLELIPAIETLCGKETDNAIKKKYLEALNKAKK